MIEEWLDKFQKSWEAKDLEGVLSLFTNDVQYFETPFAKFTDKEAVRSEWEGIRKQEKISVSFTVFSEVESKSTVQWKLSYEKRGEVRVCAGTYLISLNDDGVCDYFYQTCECKS